MFLPISSTPQPERRQTPQRRHSIEKETPTNVRQFQPPTKHSSKSLVSETTVLLLYILIQSSFYIRWTIDWTRLAFNMMYVPDFQVFLIIVNDKNCWSVQFWSSCRTFLRWQSQNETSKQITNCCPLLPVNNIFTYKTIVSK